MSQRSIARSYARALADTLGDDASFRKVEGDLLGFAKALEEYAELREFLVGPLVPLERRKKAAEAVLEAGGADPATRNFVGLLLTRHRAGLLDEIAEEFSDLVCDRLGIVDAEVTSARPLSRDFQDKTRAALARLTRREVRADFRVEPRMLGGLKAKVGTTVYDGSVRSRLDRLRDRMSSD